MQQRVKNGICMLSAAVLLALSLSAAFGAAHARYRVTQALPWVFTAQTTNSSNLLAAGGQTVVLQDWQLKTTTDEGVQDTRTVSFTVSDKAAVKEDLRVESDSNLLADLTIADGVCTLTLTPTEAAYALTQSTVSTVNISWKELSAKLTVKLCVEEEEQIVSGSDAKVMSSALANQLALIVSQPSEYVFQIYASSGESAEPAHGLRCSIDGGSTWTMLYDTQIFAFTPPEDWNGLLLLDLSGTELVGGSQDLTVRGGGTGSASTIAALPDSQMETAPFFLTEEPTQLPVNTNWLDCTFDYELQTLTQTEGVLQWSAVGEPAGLQVLSQDASLALSLNGHQLPAGHYRLVMTWRMEERIIYQSKAEFFVNYL